MDHTQFFQNSILDFYFSIGRVSLRKTDVEQYRRLTVLMTKFDKIVFYLKNAIGDETDSPYIKYFDLLYKLILFSRDITNGLGERTLSHMMIFIWYKYFPVHSMTILNIFPQWSSHKNSIGSWRDIPEFCTFIKHFAGESCPLIDTCIALMNHQLDLDTRGDSSLVSKWIPRESSKKFGWMYDRFVIQWFQSINGKNYFKRCKDEKDFAEKLKSCKRLYRHTVQRICKPLDVVETKQCQGKWSQLNPKNVSTTTLMRQKNAFLNVYSSGKSRPKSEHIDDRIYCKNNFTSFYENKSVINKQHQFKEKAYSKKHFGIHLGTIVKDILETKVFDSNYYPVRLWKQVSLASPSHQILPIIDLTAYQTPCFHDSVGIACMLAQTSFIESRIIAYDSTPQWVKLSDLHSDSYYTGDELDSLQYARSLQNRISHIVQLSTEKNGGNVHGTTNTERNMVRVFEMILKGFVETKIPPLQDMICIVLSPFDGLQRLSQEHKVITEMFHNAGYDTVPHIVYWNMSGKVTMDSGLWSIHPLENCTLLAGGSSTILRHLSSLKGDDWTLLNSYQFLEKILEKYISL